MAPFRQKLYQQEYIRVDSLEIRLNALNQQSSTLQDKAAVINRKMFHQNERLDSVIQSLVQLKSNNSINICNENDISDKQYKTDLERIKSNVQKIKEKLQKKNSNAHALIHQLRIPAKLNIVGSNYHDPGYHQSKKTDNETIDSAFFDGFNGIDLPNVEPKLSTQDNQTSYDPIPEEILEIGSPVEQHLYNQRSNQPNDKKKARIHMSKNHVLLSWVNHRYPWISHYSKRIVTKFESMFYLFGVTCILVPIAVWLGVFATVRYGAFQLLDWRHSRRQIV